MSKKESQTIYDVAQNGLVSTGGLLLQNNSCQLLGVNCCKDLKLQIIWRTKANEQNGFVVE